jgi:formaldehyde-activating enzyme
MDQFLVGDVVLYDEPHTVHVTLLLGSRHGEFRNAFAAAMTDQRPGHIPAIVYAKPSVPVLPHTVLANKHPYQSDRHSELYWGAAHAGIAAGMLDGLEEGVLSEAEARELLCIAVLWIYETADDADQICLRTRQATLAALKQAAETDGPAPTGQEVAAEDGVQNPFYKLQPRSPAPAAFA